MEGDDVGTTSDLDDQLTALERAVLDPSGPELLGAFETLAGALVEEVELDELLEHVLELTRHAVVRSSAVSVTVVGSQEMHTTATTDPDAAEVDRLQYQLAEGPCVDAIRTGEEQLCEHLADDPRWPRFSRHATQLGFDGVLAQPLVVPGAVVGALNIFVRDPDHLDEHDRTAARRIAVPAAATLANARAFGRVSELWTQLAEATDSRAVIEQAKGIVMATHGCDAEEAFTRLREVSQRSNRKLRFVAEALVQRTSEGSASS